jgi:hypothetical protein
MAATLTNNYDSASDAKSDASNEAQMHAGKFSSKVDKSGDTEMRQATTDVAKFDSSENGQMISHGTWHPTENTFAVARYNSMFIFTEKRSGGGAKQIQQK